MIYQMQFSTSQVNFAIDSVENSTNMMITLSGGALGESTIQLEGTIKEIEKLRMILNLALTKVAIDSY